ncbi:glycoside hydrolase family 3 N-terminal domain-containing protein, partial [Enterobacter hormaechei]|uniref:glycoside hydrolase family 3 N-terminal domain-containing protein n=1 Tax=Enterobacter hormaechei TaxID=158836 RepID=UPI001868E0FD
LIKHGTASDPEDAVRVALKSGINMSMSDEYYSKYLPGLVKSGQFSGKPLNKMPKHMFNTTLDWQATPDVGFWSRLNLRGKT